MYAVKDRRGLFTALSILIPNSNKLLEILYLSILDIFMSNITPNRFGC
jgi:hypothetical protein